MQTEKKILKINFQHKKATKKLTVWCLLFAKPKSYRKSFSLKLDSFFLFFVSSFGRLLLVRCILVLISLLVFFCCLYGIVSLHTIYIDVLQFESESVAGGNETKRPFALSHSSIGIYHSINSSRCERRRIDCEQPNRTSFRLQTFTTKITIKTNSKQITSKKEQNKRKHYKRVETVFR